MTDRVSQLYRSGSCQSVNGFDNLSTRPGRWTWRRRWIWPCAYTPAVACYATMATPPEDDFPTKRGCLYQGDAACTEIYRARLARDVGRARVLQAFANIGPRAQSLLVKIAERLAHGARQYGGDFDDKPRDWNQEALEEHMDAVVYMAMACMERDEAKAADKARAAAANRGPSTAMPPVDMRHYSVDPRDGAAPAPAWPLTTPGEDWEKTRDGCG